jgi:hypothetical protein
MLQARKAVSKPDSALGERTPTLYWMLTTTNEFLLSLMISVISCVPSPAP